MIIESSRQNSSEVPPLEASAQTLMDRNPLRSEAGTIRLADGTKAAMVEISMEENIAQRSIFFPKATSSLNGVSKVLFQLN